MNLLQTHNINCPYCGEQIQIIIDCSIASQEYIEDCNVCCRPIIIDINIEEDNINIIVRNENE